MRLNLWFGLLITAGGLALGIYLSSQLRRQPAVLAPITASAPKQIASPPDQNASVYPAPGARIARPPMGSFFGEPVDGPASAPPVAAVHQPSLPAPDDPLSHLSYTGKATIGDKTYAVLKDNTTNDEMQVSLGDTLAGYRVTVIDAGYIGLRRAGTNRRLAIADQFNAVPLNKSATGNPR